MVKVCVEAENGQYDIWMDRGMLEQTGERLQKQGFSRTAVITDENVERRYGHRMEAALKAAGIEYTKIVLPAGEHTKSQQYLFRIYDALSAFHMTRSDAVTAFGGGVIGDLAGFAAATYMRGVGFLQVPTTLLAQVDSSVGGKVAIDLPYAKNIIGCFYQPDLVLIDTDVLATLDSRQFASGMAEVIKYAAIADKTMAEPIVRRDMGEIVRRSCEIKADYVKRDPFDKGCRMELNFGHTLGHCIEVQSDFAVLHGEAVAIGMAAMARIGENIGLTEKGTYDKLIELLELFGLSHDWSRIDMKKLGETIVKDKKNIAGGLNVILLEKMGKAFVKKMQSQELMGELEKIL